MLTHITRYIAIVAFFLHSLLCGSMYCCVMPCSSENDVTSVSHDLPLSSCPCHSEQQDHGPENTINNKDSNRDCGHHQHYFCQCLQAAPSNDGTGFRVVLNQNLFSLPVAFLSTTAPIPTPELNFQTSAMVGCLSAFGVRLHLLLEHFLI